jgi:hypothetical protein
MNTSCMAFILEHITGRHAYAYIIALCMAYIILLLHGRVLHNCSHKISCDWSPAKKYYGKIRREMTCQFTVIVQSYSLDKKTLKSRASTPCMQRGRRLDFAPYCQMVSDTL